MSRLRTREEVEDLRLDRVDVDLELLDASVEVVEDPHGGDGDEETEGGRDERLGDAGRDRAETTSARLRHADERVDDPDDGSKETDERRGRRDRREDREALLHAGDDLAA